MAKGSTGAPSSSILNIKRIDSIPCDCKKCFHSKKAAGTVYCSYYDLFSPAKKKCSRYYPVRN